MKRVRICLFAILFWFSGCATGNVGRPLIEVEQGIQNVKEKVFWTKFALSYIPEKCRISPKLRLINAVDGNVAGFFNRITHTVSVYNKSFHEFQLTDFLQDYIRVIVHEYGHGNDWWMRDWENSLYEKITDYASPSKWKKLEKSCNYSLSFIKDNFFRDEEFFAEFFSLFLRMPMSIKKGQPRLYSLGLRLFKQIDPTLDFEQWFVKQEQLRAQMLQRFINRRGTILIGRVIAAPLDTIMLQCEDSIYPVIRMWKLGNTTGTKTECSIDKKMLESYYHKKIKYSYYCETRLPRRGDTIIYLDGKLAIVLDNLSVQKNKGE